MSNGWATTPRASGYNFWGCWGCVWPSKHSFVPPMRISTASKWFEGHKHPQHPPKNICLIRGLSPIHLMRWYGAQGLMWGARGPFPPPAAMFRYGCVDRCWPLEAGVRSDYCRNSKIVYGSIFLFLRRSHTFLTSDWAAKKGRLRRSHFAL